MSTTGNYRDYGRLDDRIAGDGDTSFRRINSRLRGSELQPGEIKVSENGRMDLDGAWQPRKGLATLYGSITQTGSVTPILPIALPFQLGIGAPTAVFGACVFSDPKQASPDDFIFTATNSLCTILRARDKTIFQAKYPSNYAVNKDASLIQAFNKIFLFQAGRTALEIEPTLTNCPIVSATRSGNIITIGALSHGLVGGDFVSLTNLSGFDPLDPDPNGAHIVVSATTDSFTISLDHSGASVSTITYGTSGANAEYWNEFTEVRNGPYTLPNQITDTVTASQGEVSFTENNHGLKLGDTLIILKGTNDFEGIENQEDLKNARVTFVDTNTFRINLAVSDGLTGIISLTAKKPISYLINMPSTPFAVVNQRRLWMPYFLEEDYSIPGRLQWKDRPNKDEIVCSDVLDPNTYDVIGQRLRITGGSNDFIVGIEPFTEDTLLVFARRSVHKLTGVSGSLNDVAVNVVTPDLGCTARKSITQVGSKILFLSDRGVYMLEYFDQYNLRGSDIPLSEPIQPIIDRINVNNMDKAVGVYFNNRYWLALALDGNSENSHIVIYNFINQGWESLDSVDSTAFLMKDFLVAREGRETNLYITTTEGGIHRIDSLEEGDEVSVTKGSTASQVLPVKSTFESREYDLNTMDRKQFTRAELHLKSSDTQESDADISFNIKDPDATLTGLKVSEVLTDTPANLAVDEDASLRMSVRSKGFSASVKVEPSTGRPLIRAIKLDGRIANRSTISKQ